MERNGVDVSLDRIADEAGVARRTIYRWVGAREDLVFIHPRLWLDEFGGAVAPHANAPLLERVRIGCAAVCAVIDADPEPVRRAMRLAIAHPELLRGYAAVNLAWIERLAIEVDPHPDTPDRRLRARTIGAAVMGAIDAALAAWSDDAAATIGPLIDRAIDHLAPILAEAPVDHGGAVRTAVVAHQD